VLGRIDFSLTVIELCLPLRKGYIAGETANDCSNIEQRNDWRQLTFTELI